MAIQKQIQPGKEVQKQNSEGLGVSLSSIKTITSNVENESPKKSDDILAYQHDAIRSIIICLLAVGIELAIYFSNIIR